MAFYPADPAEMTTFLPSSLIHGGQDLLNWVGRQGWDRTMLVVGSLPHRKACPRAAPSREAKEEQEPGQGCH